MIAFPDFFDTSFGFLLASALASQSLYRSEQLATV
jgi:hypothetical protein